jgi:hypothetical protein
MTSFIDSIPKKLREALNFSFKESLVLIALIFIAYLSYNTNETVTSIDDRYYQETYEESSAVLATIQKQGIATSDGILIFLEEKPAAKSNLKKGVTTECTYTLLYSDYGELARAAKVAFAY